MKVLDPGHQYQLDVLDSDTEIYQILTFVKREGEKFPGNKGSYCGTNLQEVLRACHNRLVYLYGQVPCVETESCIFLIQTVITLLEIRAARRHNRVLEASTMLQIVESKICGHIQCKEHNND